MELDADFDTLDFDNETIWYHGSQKRIKKFRKPTRDGELGIGIYLTTNKFYANTWARKDGFIMECYIRRGPVIDLSQPMTPRLEREIYDRHCVMMRNLYGEDGVYSLFDFKRHILSRPFTNASWSRLGYIGAIDPRSQIPGQIVIFEPENVKVIGISPGE
jgi:hypothetical protein